MNKKKLFLIATLCLLMMFLSVTALVSAETRAEAKESTNNQQNRPLRLDCFAIDVVLLVDQSGSMNGDVNTPANDLLGQRYNAARYALNWLVNNRLGRCFTTKPVHRVGVVSFGSTMVVDLEMTKLEPEDSAQWANMRSAMENKIEKRNLGFTDPALAFTEAKRMLNALPPFGELPRKRAVVFLTDGKPCVPRLGCSIYAEMDAESVKKYVNELVTQIDKDFQFSPALLKMDKAIVDAEQQYGGMDEIPAEVRAAILANNPITNQDLFSSTYVYMVTMNAASPYLDAVKDSYTKITQGHGGSLIPLTQNLSDVPKVFNQILSRLGGVTPTVISCGPLEVDPYISGATLDIFKVAEGLEVKIEHNGKQLVKGQGDRDYFGFVSYGEQGAIETYRFERPPAGIWQISATKCENVQIAYDPFKVKVVQFSPNGVLPQYDVGGQTSDPRFPYYLKYEIKDVSSGLQLQENPDFPVKMSAVLTNPQQKQTTLDMVYSPSESLWVSAAPLPVDVMGDYSIAINASAPCAIAPNKPLRQVCKPDGRVKLVSDAAGAYSVGPISLFKFVVNKPAENEVVELRGPLWPDKLPILPLNVSLQVTDVDGKAVPYSELLRGDPNKMFKGTLAAGGKVSPEVWFVPEQGSLTTFTAQIDQPAVKGAQVLTVKFEGDYKNEKYRPYQDTVVIRFTRGDPFWEDPDILTVIGIVLAILFVVLLAMFIACQLNVVRGSLELMSDMQATVTRTGLNGKCGKQTVKLGLLGKAKVRKESPSHGAARVRVIITVDKKLKDVVLTDGQAARSLTSGWSIRYTWKNR